ncbi:Na/Pi cotransporter family protein [bacterium]|jgi:phosphate:Na+ symporter|nr:Na/Pi cotransporter family protein [bacterium]MBT4250477.1 Na/Pi cotransporter family protein [bacterium]MBT5735017.1 Na/Pi cotransporter family protein [bacterium]MBT6777003.1 Na/Pi cotransporter family protein [bacterium]
MKKILLTLTMIFGAIPSLLMASSSAGSSPKEISIFLMFTSLFGGLGMFLYGMEMMSGGMKIAAGNKMRSVLEKLTSNRFLAVGVGAFVTMVIQSSSATTVMLVSFVNSGLLTFVQGLGVILGSNIGSTITAQIVAFKVTDYALALVAVGALMALFSKKDSTKNIGFVILGFGLLFYGMKVMSDTMKPLRSNPTFNDILISLENPFMGILAGAAFTALIQSSSATTGIVITLASGGSITLEAGIPLILGANVGTCVTALLAGLNASREAKRVAIAHVTFNLLGVALFCFWIPTFAEFISQTSDNIPRQIANAHTIFNILATVVFIPFTPLVGKLIVKYFPDENINRDISKPKVMHLNDDVFDTPTVAISNAQAEIRGVIGLLERVVGSVAKPFISNDSLHDIENDEEDFEAGLQNRMEKITFLNNEISSYLIKVNNQDLNDVQSREVFTLVSVVHNINSVKNSVNLRLHDLLIKKESQSKELSDNLIQEVESYHKKIIKQIKRLGKFFEKYDKDKIDKIVSKGKKFKDLEEKYRIEHIKRSNSNSEDDAQKQIYLDLMDMLKEISIFIDLIAERLAELDTAE